MIPFSIWFAVACVAVLGLVVWTESGPDPSSGDEQSNGPDRETLLVEAILDIDAHATPLGEDADGFVSGGYIVTVGALHRALGVLGHGAPKCRYCALLQADGKPGCDELRHEVSVEWHRDADSLALIEDRLTEIKRQRTAPSGRSTDGS